jgi:site-specific DNA recombinase
MTAGLKLPPELTRPRCGVYLRISSDPGNDELGVARQEKWARKFCDEYGWEPVIFKDNDISATKGKRRESYEALLKAVTDGSLRAVAVWGQDRLCREPTDFEHFRVLARTHGVLLGTRGGIKNLARAADTFNARNESNAAAYEVENMRERMKEKFAELADEGRAWWPSRPFGYTMPQRGEKRGEWTRPELVKAEADAILKAYEDVRAGRSLKEIARKWNQVGLLTPKGNPWSGMAVRALLLNPRNAALRTYQPDKTVPPEIVGAAAWPAIVSEQAWRGVRVMLTDRARLTPGAGFHTGRKHLLSGIATCSECGGALTSAPAPRPGGSVRYACKHSGCMKVKRSAADVDAWAIAHVVEILADPENVEALTRRRDIDTAELAARLKEIEGDRKQAASMIGTKQITLAQLAVMNGDWDAEVAGIEAQMRDAAKYAVLRRFIGADDAGELFDGMTLDEQRAVVRLLVTVVVRPGQAPRRPFDRSLVVVKPTG